MRKKLNLLDESISPLKIIWYLAWPTVLEQLLLTAVQYVDTAMVGSLGTNATAAVTINASTTWLINGICGALGTGFSVLVGRNIGAGDHNAARNVIRQAMLAMLVFGVAIVCIVEAVAPFLPRILKADPAIHRGASTYLAIIGGGYFFNVAINLAANIIRCSGDTKTPMFANLGANLINVVLNFFLIFETRPIMIDFAIPLINRHVSFSFTAWGAGWGVSGAAVATVASLFVSATILVISLFRRNTDMRISIKDKFGFDAAVWKSMFRLAYPVAGERFALSGGQIVMTAIVTGLGTASLVAHQLAITAESLAYLPAFGFSAAATTLVSQSLGAQNQHLAKKLSRLCIFGGVLFMSMMGVVLYVFSEDLISIFSKDPEVISLGGRVLRIEAFAQPFFALANVVSGVLRGAGDTKWPFIIGLSGMWGVRLGLAYILSHIFGLGLFGAWIAMVSDLVVRGLLCLLRYKKGNWSQAWGTVHDKAA